MVEIPDDATITVDVSDSPGLVEQNGASEPVVAAPDPAPKAETKPKPKAKEAAPDPAAALNKAIEEARRAEAARAAAEATAEAERRRALDAQNLLRQRDAEANRFREQAEDREYSIINAGIDGATRELQAYRGELKRALDAGDFDAVSDAQVKMSRAAAQLDRLEAQKTDFEAKRSAMTAEGAVEAPQSAHPAYEASPFDQWLSTMAPASQAWIRAHPECAPPELGGRFVDHSKMMAGHHDARAQGYAPNTPDYFRVIEEHVGLRHAPPAAAHEDPEPEPEPAPRQPQRVAQPSAPVSREPPSPSGQFPRNTRTVTLTKEQQEVARFSFPRMSEREAYAQYAKNLLELESEGKVGRKYA